MIKIEKKPTFKDAKDLQSLANMLAPQYSQSDIRECYLNGLLPDFIGTDYGLLDVGQKVLCFEGAIQGWHLVQGYRNVFLVGYRNQANQKVAALDEYRKAS